VNTLIPHTRTNVQNLVQFIGIVREKYQNKLTVKEALIILFTAPWCLVSKRVENEMANLRFVF
jgi:hypothetical protein